MQCKPKKLKMRLTLQPTCNPLQIQLLDVLIVPPKHFKKMTKKNVILTNTTRSAIVSFANQEDNKWTMNMFKIHCLVDFPHIVQKFMPIWFSIYSSLMVRSFLPNWEVLVGTFVKQIGHPTLLVPWILAKVFGCVNQ